MDIPKELVLSALRCACDRLPRREDRKHVLLAVHNLTTAKYLGIFHGLFAKDPRLKFWFVISKKQPGDVEPSRAVLDCPQIPPSWAKAWRWDLMVTADHGFEPLCTPERYPVVRIPHGIGSKMDNGRDYMYGPRAFDELGRVRYTRMFESSEARLKRFSAEDPRLMEVITLVGDMRVDALFAKAANRRFPGNERRSVMIAGSWNAGNIFERMGQGLAVEALKLSDAFQFSLRPHGNMLQSEQPHNWRAFFEEQQRLGLPLSSPDVDLGDALAEASVVICDDLSSVALYAALLDKPIIMMRSGSAQVAPGSFLDRLGRIVPQITNANDLGRLVIEALESGPRQGMRQLASEMNSRPGESTRLIRQEVYSLLRIPAWEGEAADVAQHPAEAVMEESRPVLAEARVNR